MQNLELAKMAFDWLCARPIPIAGWHYEYRDFDDLIAWVRQIAKGDVEYAKTGYNGIDGRVDSVVELKRAVMLVLAQTQHLNVHSRFFWDFRGKCAKGFSRELTRQLGTYQRCVIVYACLWWALCKEVGRDDAADRIWPDLDKPMEVGREGGWMIGGSPTAWLELYIKDASKEELLKPLTEHNG